MREHLRNALIAIAALAVFAGPVTVADAAKHHHAKKHHAKKHHAKKRADSTTTSSSSTGSTDPDEQSGTDHHPKPPEVTGDAADKAKAAAIAAVPGATADEVYRARPNNPDNATYAVPIVKSDGSHAIVLEDADFNVLAVKDPPARGDGDGPGHPGGGVCQGGPHGPPPAGGDDDGDDDSGSQSGSGG